MTNNIFLGSILAISGAFANATCEENVNNIDAFYINGMFTDFPAFKSNQNAFEDFIATYMPSSSFNSTVSGSYNFSEDAFEQAMEGGRQKLVDASAEVIQAYLDFINGDNSFLSDPDMVGEIQLYLQDILDAYDGTLSKQDTIAAKNGVIDLLDQCGRVVMVTHSQGNLYGNVIFNAIYSGYYFPNGYAFAAYPMLGIMRIASPVYAPGGAMGSAIPELTGHITNNTDLVMEMVRGVIGSLAADFSADINSSDYTGHSLENAYLTQSAHATNIAGQMENIVNSLTPYPMQAQVAASSSALSGFGHSDINSPFDVEFVSGGVYRFYSVIQSVFNGLQGASSQGGYFNVNIQDVYEYERIE